MQNSFNELMRYYENGAEHRTAPDPTLQEQADARDKELAGVGLEA